MHTIVRASRCPDAYTPRRRTTCRCLLRPQAFADSLRMLVSMVGCAYCVDSGTCLPLGGQATCTAFWYQVSAAGSCPVRGIIPPYGTSSSDFSGIAAVFFVVIIPIWYVYQWLSIIFGKSNLPVVGRAIRDSKTVSVEINGESVSKPVDAFIAMSMKGLVRVDLDSNSNRAIAPLTFFLVSYIILGLAPAVGMNSFSVATVTLDTQFNMLGVAQPSGELGAGMLGISNLNLMDGSAWYSNICSQLSGDDKRSCTTVAVVGGFTLLYAIVAFLCGSVAIVWATAIYLRRRRLAVAHSEGYVLPPLTFPPRFYTLIAMASCCIGAIAMMWGIAGKFALNTGALIPLASWTTGNSWLIVMLTKIHLALLEFIVWHIIESTWLPEQRAIHATLPSHSAITMEEEGHTYSIRGPDDASASGHDESTGDWMDRAHDRRDRVGCKR
jgi:hypothetical protein